MVARVARGLLASVAVLAVTMVLGTAGGMSVKVCASPSTDTIVERKALGAAKVPCLLVYRANTKKAHVVFIFHGLTGQKENFRFAGETLARRGYLVIIPDAAWHGERAKAGVDVGEMMYRIVANSAREATSILDSLKGDPRVATGRAGVAGFSMGGMTAFLVPTLDKRFVAAAPWCGSPDWMTLINRWGGWGDAKTMKLADDLSPIDHPARYYPCAILSQHGSADDGMPVSSARALFAKLSVPYRAHPGRLKAIEYRGVGHTVTSEMVDAAAKWFDKFVKPR